jgi:hypothetical protein
VHAVPPVSMVEGGGGLHCRHGAPRRLGPSRGQRLVVVVLVVCRRQGRCSAACWSSVGGGWPPSTTLSESFVWLRAWPVMSTPCVSISFLKASSW